MQGSRFVKTTSYKIYVSCVDQIQQAAVQRGSESSGEAVHLTLVRDWRPVQFVHDLHSHSQRMLGRNGIYRQVSQRNRRVESTVRKSKAIIQQVWDCQTAENVTQSGRKKNRGGNRDDDDDDDDDDEDDTRKRQSKNLVSVSVTTDQNLAQCTRGRQWWISS